MVKFQKLQLKIFYDKFWYSAQLICSPNAFFKKIKNNQLKNKWEA